MFRYFIELSYDGTDYCGWQRQPNAMTIQEEIESAMKLIFRKRIDIVGAGRTDTSVNASFYVAHFDIDEEIIDCEKIVYKLNSILPASISFKKIYRVGSDLHARFSASSRTYKYYIAKDKDPFNFRYSWKVNPVPDVNKMNDACAILMGYEDFTSFAKLHSDAKTNICKLSYSKWEETQSQIIFTIKADRFLRNMVRAIVGTMIDVGLGKISLDEFRKIVESKDRSKAGLSVPGNALFLSDIRY